MALAAETVSAGNTPRLRTLTTECHIYCCRAVFTDNSALSAVQLTDTGTGSAKTVISDVYCSHRDASETGAQFNTGTANSP